MRCKIRVYTVKQSNCIGGDGEKHLKRIKMPYIIFLIIGSLKFLLMRPVFFYLVRVCRSSCCRRFLFCFVQCLFHFFRILSCLLLFFIINSFQWSRLNFDDSCSNTANSSNGLNMDFAFHVISTDRRYTQPTNKQQQQQHKFNTNNKNMNNTPILNVRLFILRSIEMNSAAFFRLFLSQRRIKICLKSKFKNIAAIQTKINWYKFFLC